MTRTRRRGVGSSVLVTAAVVASVVVLTGGMAWLGHRVSGTGPRVPEPGPVHSLPLRLTYVGRTPEGPRLMQNFLTFTSGARSSGRAADVVHAH